MKSSTTYLGGISLKYFALTFPLSKLRITKSKISISYLFIFKMELCEFDIDSISIKKSFFYNSIYITHHNSKFSTPIIFYPFPKSIDTVLECLERNLVVRP